MRKLTSHWHILIALLLAALVGFLLKPQLPQGGEADNFASALLSLSTFLGDLFLRALKMIIVPLISSSIVVGIASVGNIEGFGRLGFKTLFYYLCTSFLAICIGLTLVNLAKPGYVDGKPNPTIQQLIQEQAEKEENTSSSTSAIQKKIHSASEKKIADFTDVFKKLIPDNILAAASTNGGMLGLIFFSILFAIALTKLNGETSLTMLTFFEGLNQIMIRITHWILAFAPIGIFGLVMPTVAKTGGEIFHALLTYFFVVAGALAMHFLLILPLLLRLLGRVSPLKHIQAMKTALLTAFSTASSSATLPITLRCVRENAQVSHRTSSFVLPLGATVNMDGTALYECVAVLFISQVMGIELSVGQQFLVVCLALLTSIGVAGVPSASLVAILLILNNLNIPNAPAAMAVLLSVDRLLDMCRTAVNVFSDSCGAVIIGKSEGETEILKH